MNNFKNIQLNLEQFIQKYSVNQLIKGVILFFSIGLLYFIITLLIEHFLWLNITARTILFWVFIVVELMLFTKFIIWPLTKLFKLQKGIDKVEASKIIGNYFPEVNDRLLNVLQLNQNNEKTELLLASIEQKSSKLKPIPFKLAINLKQNVKYIKFALVPICILVLAYVTGKIDWFSSSYERMVNYNIAYQPPAPFNFYVVNNDLKTLENKSFTLHIKTSGTVVPENAQITYNNHTYYLKPISAGNFEYTFVKPKEEITFELLANNVISKPYTLKLIKTPSLVGFNMHLNFPAYTNKKPELLKSTGNATVPQGTVVTWKLNTKATNKVTFNINDTIQFIEERANVFKLSKRIKNALDYSISTSNNAIKNHENLAYSIQVIKDEYPELLVSMKQDSIDKQTLYFKGEVSDDYGLKKLQMVYYPEDSQNQKQVLHIPVNSNVDEFIRSFPDTINVTEGIPYSIYFEVFDNDVLNNFKSAKSAIYKYRKRTQEEEQQQQLEEQKQTIEGLDRSLDNFEKQEKNLEELAITQKEKKELNYNDKKKIEEFLKRQKQQEQLMQKFNKKLKENLEKFQEDNLEQDQFKEDLRERLQENEEQLKEDEKLLEELMKMKEKIQKEEFSEKLEQLAKQNKNQKRSLEQLLELTKRYYVAKKQEKLKNDLDKLAKEQEELSNQNKENNTKEKQEDLNKKFEEFQKEMDALEKENEDLKKPMEMEREKFTEDDIKKDQQEATKQLEQKEQQQNKEKQQQKTQQAQKSQQNAAKKMKQMAAQMAQMMNMFGEQQQQEDQQMLRQILDNLVLFSFNQEGVMEQFKNIEVNHNEYATYLKQQYNLREHFEHVDDSLFALSLRNPKISETINKEITDVYFNIDKALSQLSENELYKSVSTQQYALTSANNLADFLSQELDNMQNAMMMPMPGQGDGDMQLPDIIMSQEQLNQQMKDGMKKKGEQEKKKGEKLGEQQGEQKGKNEKDGKKSKEGKDGKDGREMDNGEGSNEDLNGELYKIYQQQQQLREQLQNRIKKDNLQHNAGDILKKMEDVELDLINKGFTNKTLEKMMQLQHQLLKLENAAFKQGKDNKRESKTNSKAFNNSAKTLNEKAKTYFNTIEILNRQALPFKPYYKLKSQDYFKTTKKE